MDTILDKITYCNKCFMPSSRPRITFNSEKICNACVYSEDKTKIDWTEREEELIEILEQNRSKNGNYDCVVPWSGGKDSSSIAHRLKFKYNMNPLLVTFSPMIPNHIGQKNRESLINLGFDSFFFRPNQKVHKHLARRFFIERANPKIAWDAGVNVLPVQVALAYNIKLIFYAEHGETEYGGKILSKESSKVRDLSEVLENQIGDDPNNWVDDLVTEKDLSPYCYPDVHEIQKKEVKAYYFGYFTKWSMFENYLYLMKNKVPFELAQNGRTEGTFTNFDSLDDEIDDLYYYLQYIKFGFGRSIRDAARLLQNQVITQDEAYYLIKKYDGEFPKKYFKNVLNYLQFNNEEEFTNVVDMHRNEEIWKKKRASNSEWQLVKEVKYQKSKEISLQDIIKRYK